MNELNWQHKDLWNLYRKQSSPDTNMAKQIIHWFNLEKHLPILSYRDQIEVLDGAPHEIIEAHARLLDPRAAKKLGVEVPPKKKDWMFGKALL